MAGTGIGTGVAYNAGVIRRHLSLQLALVMVLTALLPLAGVGFLVFHLIEKSITDQVEARQDQLARAAGALVRDYLKGATSKLKTIARLVERDKNPEEQSRRLNGQVDPPGLFLEVNYVKVQDTPEVLATAQQTDYSDANGSNKSQNRSFNPKFRQYVQNWSSKDPILSEPAKGNVYCASNLDNVGRFNGLPISVPASGKDAVVAILDLNPLTGLLDSLAGSAPRRNLILRNGKGETLAASAGALSPRTQAIPAFSHAASVGHADWLILVTEPTEYAMASLRQARIQALAGFGVAAALALGMAALLGGRILSPVRALARTADRLGRGDLAARTGIVRADELGQLALAFDRMAAALQQLDQLKGEFVAHVSHELRTPLTSTKMALANLQEGIGGKDALGRVQQDLDRLIRMVNELLDVARLEAGIELARQSTDLGELVRGSVETLRPLARVKLEVQGSGATLDLDRARIQQVVVNLVDNALKYAKSRVDVLVQGREVRVTDDGPGVPAEHRERIFEKFAKVETGPKPPGAGLGLSIARKLAGLHGGSLACEGNTFTLRL